jgi:hypothetical protein
VLACRSNLLFSILWWRMMNPNSYWEPKGLYLCPWEALGHALPSLHEIFLEREANLVSIKSASSRFSSFATLPYRHHISHVRTPNNANSVSKLCGTKISSTLVFIGFLGNEDKIPKMASQDNLSDFRLVCAVGISGTKSSSSLDRIGLSICPNQSSQHVHNFGS